MGGVYKFKWGKWGRYAFNSRKDKLHKVGFEPKHKKKYRVILLDMKRQIQNL